MLITFKFHSTRYLFNMWIKPYTGPQTFISSKLQYYILILPSERRLVSMILISHISNHHNLFYT